MHFSMKQKKRYGCLGGLILLLAIVWGYFSVNHEEQPVKAGPAPVKGTAMLRAWECPA